MTLVIGDFSETELSLLIKQAGSDWLKQRLRFKQWRYEFEDLCI